MNKILRLNQLWYLTLAYFHEIVREPGVLLWGIVFPILMSLGLGLAFTKKADILRKVAVIKPDESALSDSSAIFYFLNNKCTINTSSEAGKGDFKWRFDIKDDKLGNSEFLFYELEWNEALVLLKRGTVNLILYSNKGKTEYHFDPVNSDAELTYMKLSPVIGSGTIMPSASTEEIKPLTVAGTRYVDFLIPGIITLGVMMSTMWGISYGIIEKRSKKLLRRLVATPMKKSHFLISLITVRVAMNFIEAAVIIFFALLVFKMQIQGSIAAMITLFLTGNVAFAGLAVLVSSHTSNTEVGNGLINFIVTPMMVLSGIFFSYSNFPEWSIPVIKLFPLTMLTDAMRSVFNEGAGFPEIALPAIILTTIGVIFFAAGLRMFKWH
jgi:ABC-2 type transport system permease protein